MNIWFCNIYKYTGSGERLTVAGEGQDVQGGEGHPRQTGDG